MDYWCLAKDYKIGDTVQRVVSACSLSPFVGKVISVGPRILEVKFPYGIDKLAGNLLVKVNPALDQFFAPALSTFKGKIANTKWKTTEVPSGFHRDLAFLWSRNASDLRSYDELWQKYAQLGTPDEIIRSEVSKFYRVSQNLFEMRLQEHMRKSAAYWASSNRQYRVSGEEIESGKPTCPRCGTRMKKTTYKMNEGARTRLFACPKDLFLVREDDLLGPNGEPHIW